jgi:uncharacterized membrane protein
MQIRGRSYPRDGPRPTRVIQESDGSLGFPGFILSLFLVIVTVIVVRPVHAEEVEPVTNVFDYACESFLMCGVICGCLLAVCAISISIRAS